MREDLGRAARGRRWSDEQLEELRQQRVTDLVTAGRLYGLGRENTYRLAAAGELPFPVLRLGRRYKVPTGPLLDALGLRRTGDAT